MAGISTIGKVMIMVIIVFLGFQLITNQGLNAQEVTNKSLNFSSVLPEQERSISKYADEIEVPNEVILYFYTFLEQAFKDDDLYENGKNRGRFVCMTPPPETNDDNRFMIILAQKGNDVNAALYDDQKEQLHFKDDLFPDKSFSFLKDRKVYIVPNDYYDPDIKKEPKKNDVYEEGSKHLNDLIAMDLKTQMPKSDISYINGFDQVDGLHAFENKYENRYNFVADNSYDFILAGNNRRLRPGRVHVDGNHGPKNFHNRDVYVGWVTYPEDCLLAFKGVNSIGAKSTAFILTSKTNGYKVRHFEDTNFCVMPDSGHEKKPVLDPGFIENYVQIDDGDFDCIDKKLSKPKFLYDYLKKY